MSDFPTLRTFSAYRRHSRTSGGSVDLRVAQQIFGVTFARMPTPVDRDKLLPDADHWERMALIMDWNEVASERLRQLAVEARAKARSVLQDSKDQ